MIIPKIIIPTVLIPFTLISVVISMIASFIASLFGVKLNTEGPRRLLEVLLKPRVLIFMVISNLIFYGGYKGYVYFKNSPRLESTIIKKNHQMAKASDKLYSDDFDQPNAFAYQKGSPSLTHQISVAWSRDLPKGSFAGATSSGSSLFIGTEQGQVEELEVTTGETLRSFYIGTPVSSAPTISAGFMYVGEGVHDTHHARVYKFDLKTGHYVSSYETKGHTEGRLIISEWKGQKLLFAPAGVDGMHAIDPVTMKKVWQVNVGHTDSSARSDSGLVFWGTGREKHKENESKIWAVAVNFLDGTLKWKHELPASSWMQPVIVQNDVCFTTGEIYFKSDIGGIFCYDQQTGEPTTAFNAQTRIVSRPVLFNGDLIVTDFNGRICRFSRLFGKVQWCTDTDGSEYSLASVAYDPKENVFVYPSQKDGLFSLDPESGHILSHWKPTEPEQWKKTYAPAVVVNGFWLTADYSGKVRSFKIIR